MVNSSTHTHTYTYIYIYIYVCVCMHMYLNISITLHMYVSLGVILHANVNVSIHFSIHTYIHTYVRTYVRTHMHTHRDICVYIYIYGWYPLLNHMYLISLYVRAHLPTCLISSPILGTTQRLNILFHAGQDLVARPTILNLPTPDCYILNFRRTKIPRK